MAKKVAPEPKPDAFPSEALRAEISRRGLTAYAVGRMAAVDVSILQRFLAGERQLALKTFDKVCVALGMGLRKVEE